MRGWGCAIMLLGSLGCGSSSVGGAPGKPDAAGGGPGDAAGPGPDASMGHADAGSSPEASPESGATDGGNPPSSGAWVMGYYSSWDDPANGGFYPVSAIDWDGLTHVAAAFYVPDGTGGWAAGYFDAASAMELISAAHAHGKKAIASIGGAGSGPAFEGSMQSAMPAFVSKLEALLAMGYDGLDIDWEGGSLSVTEDQTLQTSLIGALRSQNPGILLTLTAGYENENSLDDLSWYGTIAPQLDRINLMTYGMSGAWQGWESWHSSPLHWNNDTSTPTGIDASVAHYLAAHVPAAKLGIGSGFYGECYTSPVTAPAQALGGSQVKVSDGTMSYRNIMSSYYAASAYHYDSAAAVPFLTLSGNNTEGCTFVTYEDATSLAAKGAWVKAQGLGGVIIWTISEGYVASGANVQAQNPLLEAMKTALLQ
ncbi:MAG TPA: glycoside hydrolase family 18 protein [Polyangiaceae bacterium]